LIVFRMMQAVGGSMLNPVAMSIIRNTFTDARGGSTPSGSSW
jgi:MFS family permease